jgi:hypothetical protein
MLQNDSGVPQEVTLNQVIKRPRMIDSSAALLGVDYCAPSACRRLLQQNLPISGRYVTNRDSSFFDGGLTLADGGLTA